MVGDRVPAGEFREAWGVVLASTVGIGLGLTAIPFYSLGVFAGPVTAEFGCHAATT